MKQSICTLFMACFVAMTVAAHTGADVRNIRLLRSDYTVQLVMDIDLKGDGWKQGDVIVFTPRLVGTSDSIDFPEVVVLRRWAYYAEARRGEQPLFDADAYLIRHRGREATEHYARSVRYQPWMDNSVVKLVRAEGDPCRATVTAVDNRQGFTLPPPDTTWVEHKKTKDQELTGKVSGQARITFRVNRTEILPELSNNRRELALMRLAVEEVRQNPDVRITKYTLRGYASPEGSYANNVRLAEGRTESLRQYMTDRWGVPASQIHTESVPEDWEGLRRYVVEHADSLAAPDAIVSIIDQDMEPDAKLKMLAQKYPADYKALFDKCFPTLRRTDYAIEYEWLKVVTRDDGVDREMVITPREPKKDDVLEDNVITMRQPAHPWLALKTNLLFDALLTPNVEIETQLGRDSRWSIMIEDWFPWFLYRKNLHGQARTEHRLIDKIYKNAYQLWAIGGELRYWFRPRCQQVRPWLTGTFAGVYVAGGKYDWEWDSNGDQGEFMSAGLSIGRSWPLSKHWNMELSGSIGAVWGPRRHYQGEYDDTHLIWKYNGNIFYVGPTKLKLSLVWLLPSLKRYRKGGDR